jgi:hypothetical protein
MIMTSQQWRIISVSILLLAWIAVVWPCTAGVLVQGSANQVLAKGDLLSVEGDGYVNGSAAVWMVGPSFLEYRVVDTGPGGELRWTFGPDVTGQFRSGPFEVIVQDPGADGQYAISPVGANGTHSVFPLSSDGKYSGFPVSSDGTYRIVAVNGSEVLSFDPDGMDIPVALKLADDIVELISAGNSDDSAVLLTVFVEEPSMHVSGECTGTVPAVPAGDTVRLEGTMNFAPEDLVAVRVYSTDEIEKTGRYVPVRPPGYATTSPGEWHNYWDYLLDTSGMPAGEYLVEVGWEKSPVSGHVSLLLRVTG